MSAHVGDPINAMRGGRFFAEWDAAKFVDATHEATNVALRVIEWIRAQQFPDGVILSVACMCEIHVLPRQLPGESTIETPWVRPVPIVVLTVRDDVAQPARERLGSLLAAGGRVRIRIEAGQRKVEDTRADNVFIDLIESIK